MSEGKEGKGQFVETKVEEDLIPSEVLERRLGELCEAHAKWSALDTTTRGDFCSEWIVKNGYSGLYAWSIREGNVNLQDLASRLGGDIAKDFKLYTKKYTKELAVDRLKEAYEKWVLLDREEGKSFNSRWLTENGYGGLYVWTTKEGNINLPNLVSIAGGDIVKDFIKQDKSSAYSEETAIEKLEEAYKKWLLLDPQIRGSFSPKWLKLNGYSDLRYWFSRIGNPNIKSIVERIGGDLEKDFLQKKQESPYTEETAIEKLKEAYNKWSILNLEWGKGRQKFNVKWLSTNGYNGLFNWSLQEGNIRIQDLVVKVGGKMSEDFDIKKQFSKYTEDSSVVLKLRELHKEWKSLPESIRGRFNLNWCVKNANSGFVYRVRRNGGIQKFIDLCGGEVQSDFEMLIQSDDRNFETVSLEIKEAYQNWKENFSTTEEAFGVAWLRRNGYGRLYAWAHANGGIDLFISHLGGDIQRDFEKVIKLLTEEVVLKRFKEAHTTWKALDNHTRKNFNTDWLQKNGYSTLAIWSRREGNLSLEDLVKKIGGEIEKDFTKQEPLYTNESAIQKLKDAYEQWVGLDEKVRGKFNPYWLQKNGYNRLVDWSRKEENLSLADLSLKIGGEIVKAFKTQEKVRYTEEQVIFLLQEAYKKWKELNEKVRGKFNVSWLQKYGYKNVYYWAHQEKNSSVEDLVKKIGGEIEKDFEIREPLTEVFIVTTLKEAHTKWKELDENTRAKFNIKWLLKNGYTFLYQWSRGEGHLSLEELLVKAGLEVEKDFERVNKTSNYTVEFVTQKFIEAFEKWKTLDENTRGRFNIAWLSNNGYRSLYNWSQKENNLSLEELVTQIGGEISSRFEKVGLDKTAKIKKDFQELVDVLTGERSQTKTQFQSLLNIFGSSRAIDILFKFRPEFSGLPVEYVKGIIGEYLGDTLAVKGKFNPNNLKYATEYLSDVTLQDALFENIKEYCLRYYFSQKQAGIVTDSFEIIYGYIDHLTSQLDDEIRTKELDDIIQRVVEYYDSALKHFHKPEGFVDHLSVDREFPDINQRINMKELKDKKRLLIADQMGLGKSASAIMSKEQLGVKCAIIVAPSNVIATWRNYLSDSREKGGYFKPGKAPRILEVNEVKDLEGVSADQYEYILVSQEKMKSNYVNLLKDVDYGMIIVDEVHKMKSLKGQRTAQLMQLTQKIEGDDKYLALLSGTPVPNKVEDLAISLKLLYPEKFEEMTNNELVQQIIHGDIIDLRSLLLPRMQMKSLEDTIEMPIFTEETVEMELDGLEKEVYQVILEDDELTSREKMQSLMQFLLNPELVDATPGIRSTKLEEFSKILEKVFLEKDKVLVFVNNYIEGVIRGDDSIMNQLRVPAGVEVRFVHGENKGERDEIQREFQQDNKKILLIVSGDVADVGVDYSAAQEVFSYNPAWTKFKEQQQVARANRYGLDHPLHYRRLVSKLTIEEGIYEYTERKYLAVQKLLRGVPMSDLEKQLLEETEKQREDDRSVNPELAKYYFSSWDKLMRIFGYIKELGEGKFREFLEHQGVDYAEAYVTLGNRSYQANANRVSGTLLHEFMKDRRPSDEAPKILDIASGPEMLRQHIGDEYQDMVYSVDINKEHFRGREDARGVVGSVLALPFADEAFDYANLALSLHYTNFAPSRGQFERLQALMEMNRVLKIGGRGIINIIYSLDFKDFAKFKEIAAEAGFKVVEEYSGDAQLSNRYQSFVVTLEKVTVLDKNLTAEDLSEKLGADKREGLKFKQNDNKLKDSRHVLTDFSLAGKNFETCLNFKDRELFFEEQTILLEGEKLKKQYGNIEAIPREEVLFHNFVRIFVGKRYILFKKMTKGTGIVLVK